MISLSDFRSQHFFDAGIIALVALLAVIHLNRPFHGDTALFQQGADQIARGAKLYVDFWDNKQPGIFAFNFVAGSLFGFSEAGPHTLDLIWNCAFAAAILYLLRYDFHDSRLRFLAPVAAIGSYYAFGTSWKLLQLEFLVNFPMFLCLSLTCLPASTPRRIFCLFYLSGVAGGIVTIFKLLLAPIPAAFWLAAVYYAYTERMDIYYRLLGAAAGIITVLAATSAWAFVNGIFSELIWVSFVFPIQAISSVQASPFSVLFRGAVFLGVSTFPWIVFANWFVFRSLRSRPPLLVMQLFLWIAVGGLLILLQKTSWWSYHFLLLFTPIGLLGVMGLDEFLRSQVTIRLFRRWRYPVATVIGFALMPIVAAWSWQAIQHMPGALARSPEAIRAYQIGVSTDYARLARQTAILGASDALQGPIYVLGDPILYRLTKRDQAIPTSGWSWDRFPESMWARLVPELVAAKPVYIFIEPNAYELIHQRCPQAETFILQNYEEVDESSGSILYRRHNQ